MTGPAALLFVTNGISAEMGRAALLRDGYALGDAVLVKQRKVSLDWARECAEVIEFNGVPKLTLFGQVNQIGFYYRLLGRLRTMLRVGTLRDIYVSNVDNLVTNHILQAREKGGLKGNPRLSVIAEGLMNYQDIDTRDRAGWRWKVKPIIARLVGLHYKQPTGHLSGAFEPAIERVIAYSALGLKAPSEKVVVVPYPRVTPIRDADPRAAILVMTGIAQWMTPEAFEQFRIAFAAWINGMEFDRVFVKPHPHYPGGGLETLVARAEPLGDNRRLEELAAEMPAATIIGYCSTGLITIKMQRPDLRVIDWGSDFYCEHAYHGDLSVVNVLRGADVEIVEMGHTTNV